MPAPLPCLSLVKEMANLGLQQHNLGAMKEKSGGARAPSDKGGHQEGAQSPSIRSSPGAGWKPKGQQGNTAGRVASPGRWGAGVGTVFVEKAHWKFILSVVIGRYLLSPMRSRL